MIPRRARFSEPELPAHLPSCPHALPILTTRSHGTFASRKINIAVAFEQHCAAWAVEFN